MLDRVREVTNVSVMRKLVWWDEPSGQLASKKGTQARKQCCAKPREEENQRNQGHPPVSPLLQS
jgi:hypothetical protein